MIKSVSEKNFVRVGSVLKRNDPDQFQNVCANTKSRSLKKAGQYLYSVDADMFARIVEDEEGDSQ